MPRVENLGENVDEYCKRTGNGSTTHDLCTKCIKQLERDPHVFDDQLTPENHGEPIGVDGWNGSVDHPDYDGSGYLCAICGKELGDKDD